MLTIAQLLESSTKRISNAGIDSARLDSEMIISHALGITRERLLAYDDQVITPPALTKINHLVSQRQHRIPVAYIVGSKEFYGRSFVVNPSVLVPRPESERLVDYSLKLIANRRGVKLIDIGTGSGILATTIKLESSSSRVLASDISFDALEVARNNANRLSADIKFIQSDLLTNIDETFDIVVANLPYVDATWDYLSPELNSEPSIALYAEDHGLNLIKRLIIQSKNKLSDLGYLILEMDNRQIDSVSEYAHSNSFKVIDKDKFSLILQKIK